MAMLVAATLCSACGTGAFLYRGTVVAADKTGHSFDPVRNPNDDSPIYGAEVRVAPMYGEGSCLELWKASLPTGRDDLRPESKTDHTGYYQVQITYPGVAGASPVPLLCVRHPDFEPYQYMVDGESKDPRNAEKFLNIRLKPRKRLHAEPTRLETEGKVVPSKPPAPTATPPTAP